MSADTVKNIEKQINNSILRTLLAALFAIILKTLQLIFFHNDITGLLNQSFLSSLLGVAVVVCMLYVVGEYILLTLKMKREIGYVNPTSTQPLIGLALVLVGICFLFQGIVDILSSLTTSSGTMLTTIIGILTIVSAVDYAIQGLEIIWDKPKRHFVLHMVPVVWSIAVLMNVMVTYPLIVSMQSNVAKVLCSALLVMFMYYTARWACGYENHVMSTVGVFFRTAFPCLMLMFIFPYCIAFLFGVKDGGQNMPYLAMLGLSIYGFITLFQYLVLSISKLQKRHK